jgi:hypothetical protein
MRLGSLRFRRSLLELEVWILVGRRFVAGSPHLIDGHDEKGARHRQQRADDHTYGKRL